MGFFEDHLLRKGTNQSENTRDDVSRRCSVVSGLEAILYQIEWQLVTHYQWTPFIVGDLYLKEALYYLERIQETNALESQKQLAQYKMLLTLIHGDPKEILEKLNQIEKDDLPDDEIGNLEAIECLKAERGWS